MAQICAVDIEFLADKCHTLMASDIHNIKLFTDSFIRKLFKCSHSNLLKIYLLPFNTWLDNAILRELVTAYKETVTLKLFCKFDRIIDYTQPITSYPIPMFSQLIIPLDDSEYTIVATETIQCCDELILKDVTDIKEFLRSQWEITDHAIQLVAIDYKYNCIYWMIPKQVQPLIESRLNQGQQNLRHGGIFMTLLLPNDIFSADNEFDHRLFNSPFDVSNPMLKNTMQVCVLRTYGMNVLTAVAM